MEIIVPIIVACITGGLSLIGAVIATNNGNKQIEQKLFTSQAVTETKLDSLTEEVRRHNNFASEIPEIKVRLDRVEKDVEDLRGAKNE